MDLSFKEFLRSGKDQLAAAGYPEVDAEHLLAHVLGISRMELHNPVLVENAITAIGDTTIIEENFWKLLDRRCAHEPLQYLTGIAYFRYLELEVGPGVLVPRPESELLVEAGIFRRTEKGYDTGAANDIALKQKRIERARSGGQGKAKRLANLLAEMDEDKKSGQSENAPIEPSSSESE